LQGRKTVAKGDAKAHGCVFQGRKTCEVAINVYLRKTLDKPKVGLQTLSMRGLGVVYARWRYLHPMRLSQGMTASNQICKSWLQYYLFSLLSLCFFFMFSYFFVVDKGVFLAPTYPQLRWENHTYIVLCKNLTLAKLCWSFFARLILTAQKLFKELDL